MAEGGDGFGGEAGEGGFATLAPMRGWGKVGGVRFDHEGAGWNGFDGVDDRVRVFEGRNAGKGNETAEVEDALGEFGRAGKAMKDRSDAVRKWRIDFEGVLE